MAKQCKFLVAAACRSSEETYARLLGKLQLNGFEITAAEAEAEAGASGRENGDEEKASSGKKQRDTARAEEEGKINAAVLREPVGLGVFPSASRFNHSCEPNCAQRFDAFACVVVETTRHVRQGRSSRFRTWTPRSISRNETKGSSAPSRSGATARAARARDARSSLCHAFVV